MNRFQKSLLVFGLITLGAVGKLGLDFCLGYSLKPLDWSPDGRWIAAQLEYGGFRDGYALALVSAKTGRLERILYNNQDGGSGFPSAAFSPDSRFVTYHFLGDYVVDLQGKHTNEIGPGATTSWSPDSKWLAQRDSDGYVSQVRPDGTGRRALEVVEPPRRLDSPDGHWYAYLEPTLANYDCILWLKDQGGKSRKILAIKVARYSSFAWRPNGELVYTESEGGKASVVAYNPRTQQQRIVAEGFWWALSPDGNQLAQYGENRVRVVPLAP